MMSLRRFLSSLSLRCYPRWWRDRYRDKAALVVDDLLAEGRGGVGIAASFAWDGLQTRLRGTPLELGPPAAVRVQRGGGKVQTAWALYIPLAWVAFGLAGVDPVSWVAYLVDGGNVQRLWDTASTTRFGLGAFLPLALGFAIFLLWVMAACLTTAVRAVRQHDPRAVALSFVPICVPVVFFFVGFCDLGELHIGFGGFAPSELFARLLTFSMGSMRASQMPRAPLVLMGVLSWLAVLASVAVASWSVRLARGRVGLGRRFLRTEAFVSTTTTLMMSLSWVGLVLWGAVSIGTKAVPFCFFCTVMDIPQPQGPGGLVWWIILGCLALISTRASLAAVGSYRSARALRAGQGITVAT